MIDGEDVEVPERLIDQHVVTLGDHDYVLQEFNTSDGLFWTATLAQLFSGILLGVDKLPETELDIHIGRSVRGLALHLTPEQFVELCKRLYKNAVMHPEYNDSMFEYRFKGGRGQEQLFTLLTEIVTFNYAAMLPTLKKTIAAFTGGNFSLQPVQADK